MCAFPFSCDVSIDYQDLVSHPSIPFPKKHIQRLLLLFFICKYILAFNEL